MSKKTYVWISIASLIMVVVTAGWLLGPFEQPGSENLQEDEKLSAVEMKKARSEYFFRLLRDPATNRIPDNIRSRELNYSRQLPIRGGRTLRKSGQATQQAESISWQSAGPNELGGRTRALAIDQRDSDVIIAGGVSGGIWKSTDGGNAWEMKTDPNQNMSVTSVAQDPTSPDTWYYSSGEFLGNSASGRGGESFYHGTGLFKSTNNGDSWSRISSTSDTDNAFSSGFDYISRVKVSPTTGSVFLASNAVGIKRSTDGSNFTDVLGSFPDHSWADIDIDSNGNLIAVLSTSTAGGGSASSPGVYYSTDDGDSWTEVTPADFPSSHDRSVITFAPSNPDIVYVFTRKLNDSSNQGVSFFRIDVSDPDNPTADDRSENLPDFGNPVGGVNLQGGYNMVVSVKPDDPDFVMVGATNLFRSTDGFATAPADTDNDGQSDDSEKDEYWIGGYAKTNNVFQYDGQHPDQHVIAYDPNDPNKVWAGHDGGLSLTTDITATSVDWDDKDNGYVTGQFYTVDIPSDGSDNRILGGTQDNGTPFFRTDDQGAQQTALSDISSGDGSYGFFTENYIFSSSQNGNIRRHTVSNDGSIAATVFSVQPPNASNQLFIHPYAVDPNDEGVMFYPDETTMWRNTSMDQNSPETNWNSFSAVTGGNGHLISALEMTNSPSGILYYAASSSQSSNSAPKIYRLENASSSTSPAELSATGAPDGAYVHDLAVNPQDGDELIAVMSNYNIVGLYHSTDGGSSWTAIEGNLEGDSFDPGPSIRSATILPTSSGTMYVVGTSTGVYSTSSLSGGSTDWTRESADGSAGSIGFSVAEYVTSRPSDGTIAVGTHGRGIFLGQTGGTGGPTSPVDFTLNIANSWQLVGSPMASASEVQLGNNLTIFEFSGTYKSSSSIESQKGYWVKSRAGSQIDFVGEDNTSATIALDEGWNIIGGITDTVATSNISDPNGILSSTPVQEYVSGSYQNASDIKAGHGYWIHANQSGNIEISTSSSSSKQPLAEKTPSFDRIIFSNGQAEQRFFAANQEVSGNTMNEFRMPPKAPKPVLDVRTSDGFRLAEGESTELALTANSFPVSVSLPQQASTNYLLKGVTGQDTVYYELRAGKDEEIQRPSQQYFLESLSGSGQITEHSLLPNYPNPFNPTTRIRYQVASQTNVSIEVYNVLGQKVRTLVNQEQPSGSYTVQFDGRNLSSGTYFIHLKAGNAAKVQKMTLIK